MAEHTNKTARHLNPFAFPAETNARFFMLIVAILLLACIVANVARTIWSDVSPISPGEGSASATNAPQEQVELYASEFARWFQVGATTILPTVLVFAVAWNSYKRHPERIRNRQNLTTLPPGRYPQFTQAIRDLTSHAAITPPPNVETPRQSMLADGQTFGLPEQYSLRLGGRMPLLMKRNPAAFRSVVLHELAHIANGDISRTYFAQALERSVFFLIIIPFIVMFGWNTLSMGFQFLSSVIDGLPLTEVLLALLALIPDSLGVIVQFGGTLLVTLVIYRGLLHHRTVYADQRAVLWGAEDGLRGILKGMADDKHPRKRSWKQLWWLYPKATDRLKNLDQPERLFQIPLDLPVLAGFLLGGILSNLTLSHRFALSIMTMLAGVTSWIQTIDAQITGWLLRIPLSAVAILVAALAFWIPIIAAGYLLTATLGLQLERQAAATVVAGNPGYTGYFRLLASALLLVAGLQIGLVFAPPGIIIPAAHTITDAVFAAPIMLVQLPLELTLWALFSTGVASAELLLTQMLAARLLKFHAGATPPHTSRHALMVLLGMQFTVLVSLLLVGQMVIYRNIAPVIDNQLIVGLLVILGLLIAGAGITIVSWGIVELMIRNGKHDCPACDHQIQQKAAIGQKCEHCGADLAPWVFAEPVTLPD